MHKFIWFILCLFSVFANIYCSINKKRGLGIGFRYSLSSSDDSMADGYAEAMWLCSRAATMAFSMHALAYTSNSTPVSAL